MHLASVSQVESNFLKISSLKFVTDRNWRKDSIEF